jgi:hypothetical protein
MPPNEWLAIDGATPPMVRAKQLRREWENFLGNGRVETIRAPIAASWRRSHTAGVDPGAVRVAPALAGADETAARWKAHPVAAAAPLIRECLGPITADSANLIVVGDADGTILWIEGPANVRLDAADSMNFTEGAGWSESAAGTNAIGTSLTADHALQVFAGEHYNEVVHEWTCSAAPVHDPDTGQVVGIIDVTGKLGTVHPYVLNCAAATARAVEYHLRCLMYERDARLRERYEDRIAGGRPRAALVTPSGRVISGDDGVSWVGAARVEMPAGGGELTLPSGVRAVADPVGSEEAFAEREVDRRPPAGGTAGGRRRLTLTLLTGDQPRAELDGQRLQLTRIATEILVLLSARPGGMTSEELAAELYGDDGQPGTARVQICRLRRILGPWIDTGRYRLLLDVESDLARVRALLGRGAVREAAGLYDGPLLPASEAPGIVRERDTLDGWLRDAVMTADDAEALWSWAQSSSGSEDLAAWKRLLANLDYDDPRRSLAASRVRALRAAYGLERPSPVEP